MNELDQFIKHELRVRRYVRYTDDFVLVHHEREYLVQKLDEIEKFLRERLQLSLHPNKISLRKLSQGIDFLGYVILPHTTVIRRKTRRRILKKIHHAAIQLVRGEISEESFFQSVNSYFGVLRHAKAHKFEQELRHKIWEWTSEK